MALLTSSARTRLRRAFQTRLGLLHEGWSRPSFHPAGFGSESPSSTANLSRYLAIWCSAASQRVLLSGSSFCSRLAMNNAPMKSIQELAGHPDLSTTMRYMHLSPALRDGAIRLLERGNIAATGSTEIGKSSQ